MIKNQNIPEIFITNNNLPELLIHDFEMTSDVIKSRVNLGMHMFSFLQAGSKQVHFSNNSIAVNKEQSLLVKKGNCLMTELLMNDKVYFCKLLFFSSDILELFLTKHESLIKTDSDKKTLNSYFTIKNDAYINAFVNSLNKIQGLNSMYVSNLLKIKFEELLLYLLSVYGSIFIQFIQSLAEKNTKSTFKKVIDANANSNLKLEEIAFLCNMSLSTFKRHFIENFNESPGKWLKKKRLERARELLCKKDLKISQIYEKFGYKNTSNFTIAFKRQFGVYPTEI